MRTKRETARCVCVCGGGGGGSKIERVEEREGGKDLRRREVERGERKQEGGKETQRRERERENFINISGHLSNFMRETMNIICTHCYIV